MTKHTQAAAKQVYTVVVETGWKKEKAIIGVAFDLED
jgi:hypothetical protein